MRITPKTVIFKDIPVSRQGQITLPKTVREHLGIGMDASKKSSINIVLKESPCNVSEIYIETSPTVEEVFGILKPPSNRNYEPVDINKHREALALDRARQLGYSIADD